MGHHRLTYAELSCVKATLSFCAILGSELTDCLIWLQQQSHPDSTSQIMRSMSSHLGDDIEEVNQFGEWSISSRGIFLSRLYADTFRCSLRTFKAESLPPSIIDVFSYVQGLSAAKRALMSEVVKVVELSLVGRQLTRPASVHSAFCAW